MGRRAARKTAGRKSSHPRPVCAYGSLNIHHFSILFNTLGRAGENFFKRPFPPWGIRGKSPAYTSLYATSRLRVWPKGKKLLLGRAAAFRKNLSVGRAAAEAGPAGFAFSRKPFVEKAGAPCGVQRKLYGRLLFSFSTDSGAFPSFSKGEPGEYPKAPPPSGLTAAGQNGTITLLNGKVRFPLPPLSRGIDRAGRHSFGIAAAGAACILIERKQGPEQNGTKPGRECPAAWE